MSRVYVTGGNGFLGSSVVAGLAALANAENDGPANDGPANSGLELIVSGDLRDPLSPLPGVAYERADVTEPQALLDQFRRHRIDTVVHLAAIVNPGKTITREQEYRVDVDGSRNVLDACLATGVRRIVVSSSGAAYGYHSDNPEWIDEDCAIRGNEAFAYSHHKRLVEVMLAEARTAHPELEQVVFRIGTILGATVDNQITALFERKRILAIAGSASPFVFIWDQDAVGAMVRAATDGPAGVFNVAGDGAVTVRELAKILRKPTMTIPAWLLQAALAIGHALSLTAYGPEQVGFLRYRPVLLNTRLKEEFGYTPRLTSREALEAWQSARAQRRSAAQ